MLRPPTEVVASKQANYGRMGAGSDRGTITRTAAWVNMMLHTERATRGHQRRFVRYADLLDDWTRPVFALGEAFDLSAVKTAMAVDIAEVHRFIDPSLRRASATWDEIGAPQRLRDLADETWEVLDGLAEEGGDTAAAHQRCDELRVAYDEQYAEAEAFAHSSVLAARRDAAARARQEGGAKEQTKDVADRLPHAVRAMVPPSARRGIRKALGKERERGGA
jgi:hypothetical protein